MSTVIESNQLADTTTKATEVEKATDENISSATDPKKTTSDKKPKKKKNKKTCSLKGCKRKKLLYRTCRCGFDFCNHHVMPEEHDCTYDYKAAGRKQLEKDNVSAIPKKFQKI